MNKSQLKYSLLFVLVMTLSFPAHAGNELRLVRSSPSSLDILLNNTDDISGIQFSVHSSRSIKLHTVSPGDLTINSSWIVGSYAVNDSTMNVLILNAHEESIPHGLGVLASLRYTQVDSQEVNAVELSNVLGINHHGDSVGVTIVNIQWQEKALPAAMNGESNAFVLGQNFPNPFNPSTVLSYRLNLPAAVHVRIFDIAGREVIRLIDEYQYPGDYHIRWNSNSSTGQKVSSGVYIVRLDVNQNSVSRKMILTK